MIELSLADKLSIPFGVIIGPCTIVSNIVKFILDIRKTSSLMHPLLSDHDFSQIYPGETFQSKIDILTSKILVLTDNDEFYESFDSLNESKKKSLLDKAEKYQESKIDFDCHLAHIGIGIIRSLPIVGGIVRCLYIKLIVQPDIFSRVFFRKFFEMIKRN